MSEIGHDVNRADTLRRVPRHIIVSRRRESGLPVFAEKLDDLRASVARMTPCAVRSRRRTRDAGCAALILCALVLSSGCVTVPGDPGEDAGLDGFVVYVAMFPWQSRLAWTVTLHDNASAAYPHLLVRLAVEKRGGVPAGDGEASASMPAANDTQVRFSTPALGFGDYLYEVEVEAAEGKTIARAAGVVEHCGAVERASAPMVITGSAHLPTVGDVEGWPPSAVATRSSACAT